MSLRTLNHQLKVDGRVVLLRIDADVPVVKGKVLEGVDGRLARAAVGIEWLRQRGAKVVVIGHRGRPNGKRVPALSMAPVVRRLEQLLGGSIGLSKELTGPRVEKRVQNLSAGGVLCLENIRFAKGETEDDTELARKLAKLGEIFVNDAFAVSHRQHTSVHALAQCLPSYAGLELQREVEILSDVLKRSRKSFLVVLGGKKIHTKIETLEAFLKSGARVCVGGALATPFLQAKGWSIGRSYFDERDLPLAERLLKTYSKQIVLPEDVVTVRTIRHRAPQTVVAHDAVPDRAYMVDIGPLAIKQFREEIESAKTIVWNGPLGIVETSDFAVGTHAVVKRIALRKGKAVTVVGGGDTLPVINELKLNTAFSLVSTGGGAMMSFLAGEQLPGVEILKSH